MTNHSELTIERWSRFELRDQILQIGLEMYRGRRFVGGVDTERVRNGYERAMRLCDLTVQVQTKHTLRKELLRWRDVVAELYLSTVPDARTHDAATRAVFQLHPAGTEQCALLPW